MITYTCNSCYKCDHKSRGTQKHETHFETNMINADFCFSPVTNVICYKSGRTKPCKQNIVNAQNLIPESKSNILKP